MFGQKEEKNDITDESKILYHLLISIGRLRHVLITSKYNEGEKLSEIRKIMSGMSDYLNLFFKYDY